MEVTGPAAAAAAWLLWMEEAGVDACILEPGASVAPAAHRGHVLPPPAPRPPSGPPAHGVPEVERRIADARALARSCRTLAELEEVLRHFDLCPLAATATRLCFADGSPEAELFLVGEAPGAAEDRLGRPFVGPSGRLLDRMLAWVGLDRSRVWITNTVFWRPPGNRPPTSAELALCLPFLERQIALVRPKVLLFLGGLAARVLLGVNEGVSRLRGRQFVYASDDLPQPVPAFVTYHPAYLLRQPVHKRYAWRDLLAVTELLGVNGFR
ncbi:hypothetical protein HRbin39_01906 [bacterium HR39]|nr:hypothetical protein HRbin39_01906 [bacterium HR39]